MTARSETQALPRGRHAAPREVVWESHRERLLAAMASVVAEKGYARVAVADVIAHAAVSRRTFYEHFENKEQCFLAAWDASVDLLQSNIREAIRTSRGEPLEAATAGTRAFLATLAENPELARTFLIEVLAAGPEALRRRSAVNASFAEQLAGIHAVLREQSGELAPLPDYVFRASVGAINELVIDHLTQSGAETLPELELPILRIELALAFGDGLAAQMLGRLYG